MLNIGAQFHGTWSELTDSDRERILDAIAGAGAKWVRVDIGWSMVQPDGKGKYDVRWGVPFVERVLAMAHDRGLKILGTFWRTPEWASGKTSRNVFPRNPTDYANALEWVARRWRTQVNAWEIWNEPNAVEFLDPPDPIQYAALLRKAYPAVKRGNPDALVVFGGPMFVDTAWIDSAYRAGIKADFDVMAVHPYQGNAEMPPNAPSYGRRERLTSTAELIKLMERNGDAHKPIWFTEFGWSTHDNTHGTPVWFLGVSEARQAQYLKEALDLIESRYPQVTHAFWYTSRDLETGRIHQDNRGLIRKDFSEKAAMGALRDWVRAREVVQVHAADHSRGMDG